MREVAEEVGVRVTNIRYQGSQAWPYPHQVMVGFTAEYDGGDIHGRGSWSLKMLDGSTSMICRVYRRHSASRASFSISIYVRNRTRTRSSR